MAASSPELPDPRVGQRLAWALTLSLIAHGMAVLAYRPGGAPGTVRFQAHLRPAPAREEVVVTTRSAAVSAERSILSPHASERRLVRRPEAAADTPTATVEAASIAEPRSGRDMADDAKADLGRVLREMSRQEHTLDPARFQRGERREAPRDAVAAALEKRFGRPMPFHEESNWVDANGAMSWRIATEAGAVCFKELPTQVLLSAPGQGIRSSILVPMLCD